MLNVECPSCKKTHKALEALAGKAVRCKYCHAFFVVQSKASATRPLSPSQSQQSRRNLEPQPSSIVQQFTNNPLVDVTSNKLDPLRVIGTGGAGTQLPSTSGMRPLGQKEVDMAETPQQGRVCESCAQTIPVQALKCPHCQEWRNDIQYDRSMKYGWMILGPLGGLAWFIFGVRQKWWLENEIFFYKWSWQKFFYSASGLALIAWGVIAFILTMYYSNRYNKKTMKH